MKSSFNEESSVNAILEIIGKKLIQLRIEKGFKSHADFAAEYGLPKIQYWRMEKGKANITLKSLSRITAIHGIPVEQFFRSLLLGENGKNQKIPQPDNGQGNSVNGHSSR